MKPEKGKCGDIGGLVNMMIEPVPPYLQSCYYIYPCRVETYREKTFSLCIGLENTLDE